jgi:hypothetical protein
MIYAVEPHGSLASMLHLCSIYEIIVPKQLKSDDNKKKTKITIFLSKDFEVILVIYSTHVGFHTVK